ncbi:MAG: phosphatase PAP2 family protein [Bosea sp. (in: a-proteobacteria)]|nr:MAG: phosphatase PAP2 family protein [Bosea sp. (in: a-proteobacteria)]
MAARGARWRHLRGPCPQCRRALFAQQGGAVDRFRQLAQFGASRLLHRRRRDIEAARQAARACYIRRRSRASRRLAELQPAAARAPCDRRPRQETLSVSRERQELPMKPASTSRDMPGPRPSLASRAPSLLQPHLALPILAALAFLALAAVISTGHHFGFDRTLILLLREPGDPTTPLGPAWLQEAVRDMTALGSFVGLFFMTTAAALALWLCGHRPLAIGLVISVLSALVVSNGLKIAIGRDRPDIVTHEALTFTASFPSGHAFLSTVTMLSIAGFIGLSSKRADIARLCLVLAWVMIVLIGLSRLYLGVHWPTDVLGGWLLGVAWASLVTAWIGRWAASSEPA